MVIGTNIPCKNGNLKITKRIGSGSFSDIFLACDKDNVEYALKFLKHNEEIDRSLLLTEAKLIATINAPFLRTVYEIGVFDNRPYLVLHYFDGVSLASLLDNEKKFDIKKILVILKQLSLALSKIHQRGLVHRDIKLENILIDDDLNICLIDFGLAQEQENLENEGLIGSFYYMSPEQCRALHRPVDHRSDLYSLGIVAFACVTGHLPFQGQSIPEMVDHHAKTPIPDFKKFGIDAPDVIEKIIRKLLSKDPDDRYQSAEGLYHDLQNFEDLSKKPIEKELLDRNFTKDQIFCKTSMYGREKEIEEMQKAYTSMKSEHGILLIEGQPGLGKSRLVSEFFKDHEGSHYVGHYKSKKNYQSPFLGIRALFQNLILKFNNNQKKYFLEKIFKKKLISFNNLCQFSPELFNSSVLKKFKACDQEMSETIQQLFEVILEVCGQTIFFIDDIQWLDHASSKLITKILRFSKKQTFFMVVATSRSDHDSLDALERFKKNNAKLIKKNINLEPLEKNQTKPIIIDFFGNQTVPVEIIDWIYNRSEGSPFAIHEYSKSVLYSENVSFSWGEWILLKNIEECKEISANLVNSIVSSFNSLSVNCKEILKISSVDFGFINADILSSVTKMSNKSISRYLSEAVEKGFIEYRKKDVLAFRHDKIMEACFSVVTDAEKLNYHNEILSYLIKHEESFDVYRIVNHIKFDFYKKEPNQCFQFIMKAGLSSMKDGSYEDAEKQFQFVLDHKELFDIENNFEFYYAAAIAVSRSTRNHEALSLSETALKISGSNQIARAELYEVRSKIYLVHINLEKSIENTILGFDALGMPYRDGAFSNFTSAIWTLITSYKKDYKHLYRERTDEEAYFDSIYIRLNASLFHTGFHLLRHDYLMHGQTRNLEFLKTRGSIKDLALMYGALSVTLAVLSLKKSSVKLVKKALAYANSVQDYSALSEIMHYSTLGYDMTGDPLQALQISLNNVSDMKRWLPPTNVLEGLSIRAQIFIARGAITEALNDYNSHLNEISELPEDGVTCLYFKSIKAVLLLMTGDVKGSAELMRNQEHMMEKLKASSFLLSHYLCEKMYLALFSGDVLENIDSLHNLWCKSLNFNPRTAIHQAKHYYIAHAHALFESCLLEKTKGGISDNSRKKMKEASYSLKICNGKSFFKTHSYYIQAGEYYLDGDFKKSRSMIEKARISAEEYSVFWIICACLRLESLILKETGYTEVANERMESANFLANKYQLNFLVDHEISTAHHVITQSHGSRSLLQSTSGDIRSKKYLDSLLNISIYCYQKKKIEDTIYYALFEVVSNLNAERAFLVLNKDDSSDVYGLNSEKENIVEEFSTADQIVIQDVHRNESPYVSDDVEYEIVGSHRIESNIRSIIAAPIIINDVKLGLLYLDSRIIKGVFNSSDIEIVSAMANHIGAAIESHKSAQVELERQEALKNLEITGVIQKLLLPLERELSNNGFDLLSYFLPASQSGGDWMWYHVAEDKTVIAIVGDVTDHGPGPAMITAVIAGCYQALMKTYSSPHHHMNEIIESFQRCIQGMGGGKYWMSMSIIAFNPDTMNLQAWSLGAPPVIVVREQSTVFLNAPSSPLGSDDFTVSESLSLQLDTDDTVLMFTDGIYEYPMKNGRHMTLGKLKKMISSQIEKKNVKNALEQLLGFIKENHADSPQEDDMTVVLLKVYKH